MGSQPPHCVLSSFMSWVELNKAAGGFSAALFSSESGNEAVGGFSRRLIRYRGCSMGTQQECGHEMRRWVGFSTTSFGFGAVRWACGGMWPRNDAACGFHAASCGFGLFKGRARGKRVERGGMWVSHHLVQFRGCSKGGHEGKELNEAACGFHAASFAFWTIIPPQRGVWVAQRPVVDGPHPRCFPHLLSPLLGPSRVDSTVVGDNVANPYRPHRSTRGGAR